MAPIDKSKLNKSGDKKTTTEQKKSTTPSDPKKKTTTDQKKKTSSADPKKKTTTDQKKKTSSADPKKKESSSHSKKKTSSVSVKRGVSMNIVIKEVISNPSVQEVGMSFLRNLVSGKKGDSEEHRKEIDALRRQVENLTKENENKNSKLLESTDRELKATIQRNEELQSKLNQVQNRRKSYNQQKAGTSSSDLTKEKDDLNKERLKLEKEKQKILAFKEEKEKEVEALKMQSLLMKEDNKELNDLVRKLSAKVASNEEATTSGSKDISEDDLIKLIRQKLDTQQSKDKGNSGKKNKSKNKNVNPNSSGDMINAPLNVGPSSPNVPGPSHKMPLLPTPYTNQYMMGHPHPNVVPPNYSPNMVPINVGFNMAPPQYHNQSHNWGANHPNYNQNMVGPPLQMGSHNIPPLMHPPTAPPHHQSFKPNIINKPNNFGNKSFNEKSEKNTNNKDESKNKRGPGRDLWAELDILKQDMKGSNSSKKDLCDRVSNMIVEATKSSVTSKESLLGELAECLTIVNRMPDNSTNRGSGYRGRNYNPNYRGHSRRPGDNSRASFDGGDDQHNKTETVFPNSASDNDDVSSLCSEPAFNNRGGGGRGRGGFKGHNYRRFGKDHSAANKSNDQQQNDVSDDNNCSGDDAASVCSERSYNKNYRGRGGRGNWRGGWKGHGNYRGNRKPQSSAKSSNAESNQDTSNADANLDTSNIDANLDSNNEEVELAVEAVENLPEQPAKSAEQAKKKNVKKKKNKKGKESVDAVAEQVQDLLTFDDDEKVAPVKAKRKGYASEDILISFSQNIPTLHEAIGKKINVTLKVEDCLLIATSDGSVVNTKPDSLLDIIQFKLTHPDAVCIYDPK